MQQQEETQQEEEQKTSFTAAQRQEEILSEIAAFVAKDPQRALSSAQRVFREAREHKRLANQYRRRAQYAKTQFNEFKKNLEALGIEVIIEDATYARKEGTSDHRSNYGST